MTIDEIKTARQKYNNIHNEGGEGYNPFDEILEAEGRRLAATPRWTREQTQANRAAWNTSMRAFGASITIHQIRALEAQHGFTHTVLAGEISKHNL